jgi:hypothetical protein
MRIIIFLFIPIGFIVNMPAQDPVQRITEKELQSFSEGRPIVTTNMNALFEGVKGTPYFNEEWKTGDIYFTDGTEINQINIRYNIYKDELEFKNSTSGQAFKIDRARINGFRMNGPGNNLQFERFELDPGKSGEKSFIQVLYKGETMLLLKYKKQFIQADYKGAYSSGNKYDEYLDDKEYYLVKDNDTVRKIKLNRKSVLKALEDHQPALEEYASINKIDFTDPEDIIKLLSFYDSLE